MCRSDALIGLSSTRTSASPGAKGGVGISASFNTLFGSPVSRKINAFINTSWVFRRRLISGRMFYDFGRIFLDQEGISSWWAGSYWIFGVQVYPCRNKLYLDN